MKVFEFGEDYSDWVAAEDFEQAREFILKERDDAEEEINDGAYRELSEEEINTFKVYEDECRNSPFTTFRQAINEAKHFPFIIASRMD